MSQEVFIRGIFSGIMALTFACVVFFRYDPEAGTEVSDTHRQKYLPYTQDACCQGFSSLLPSLVQSITAVQVQPGCFCPPALRSFFISASTI